MADLPAAGDAVGGIGDAARVEQLAPLITRTLAQVLPGYLKQHIAQLLDEAQQPSGGKSRNRSAVSQGDVNADSSATSGDDDNRSELSGADVEQFATEDRAANIIALLTKSQHQDPQFAGRDLPQAGEFEYKNHRDYDRIFKAKAFGLPHKFLYNTVLGYSTAAGYFANIAAALAVAQSPEDITTVRDYAIYLTKAFNFHNQVAINVHGRYGSETAGASLENVLASSRHFRARDAEYADARYDAAIREINSSAARASHQQRLSAMLVGTRRQGRRGDKDRNKKREQDRAAAAGAVGGQRGIRGDVQPNRERNRPDPAAGAGQP